MFMIITMCYYTHHYKYWLDLGQTIGNMWKFLNRPIWTEFILNSFTPSADN